MTKQRTSPTTSHQLVLVDTPRTWRLDEHTREIGREGLARARAAMRDSLRHRPSPDPPAHPHPHPTPGPRPGLRKEAA
jgi:hypothetical protein